MDLWNNSTELRFFQSALADFASPEQLFYKLSSGWYAYVPKHCSTEGQTLQSRNALIGNFTEKWAKDIFEPIARQYGLYAVNGVECPQVGLQVRSEADLAFCTTNAKMQEPRNIKIIFEIKMSVVSNYQYISPTDIQYIGNYKTHKGNPSLLRSDSMLKAIGKSINIRVSGIEAATIPIVVLGNSPITENYRHKVDFLKTAGVIQGFWSLNPAPVEADLIDKTEKNGFQTIQNSEMLKTEVDKLLHTDLNYISSMISKPKLGECIRIANQEPTDKAKAERFIALLRSL
jgi:hypothetical protein